MPNFRPVVVLAAIAAVGCSQEGQPTGTAELRLSQTYVLRAIDGDVLPAVFTDNEFATQRIVADTLLLESRGRGREVQVLEILDKTTGEQITQHTSYDLTFDVDGGRIEIAYECNDVIILASCIAPPHLAGWIVPTGLRFDIALGRTPLAFERVDP